MKGDSLKRGATKSCGCLHNEMISKSLKRHGMTDSKLYGVWRAMKARCYTPSATYYSYYGGRGISVCEEWKTSFESFYRWAVETGYVETDDRTCTLDRIDVDGNYEPDNCRWVTSVAQANNRRSNQNYTYNGETHNVTQWAHIIGISPKTLFSRLYSGLDFEEAIQINT